MEENGGEAYYQRLFRRRTKRRHDDSESDEDYAMPPLNRKECDQANCELMPICCLQATERCPLNHYTPKWLHLSYGEHCCLDCSSYFNQPHREGYQTYKRWCQNWTQCKAAGTPGIREFITDTILCYWLRCTDCYKWRQIPEYNIKVTPELVTIFTCKSYLKWIQDPCSSEEDPRVQAVSEKDWIAGLLQPPLLVAPPFLARQVLDYPSNSCGLSPRRWTQQELKVPSPFPPVYKKLMKPFRPHIKRMESHHLFPIRKNAGWVEPDAMDEEEEEEFSEYKNEPKMYLGIRNLIVALWNRAPKSWLSLAEVERHLVCRGLARIRCMYEAQFILRFLTVRGLVNVGLVRPDPGLGVLCPNIQREKVVIVGSGLAGLAAAISLSNMGFEVTVLESRSRIGGRISDNILDFGIHVGKGCQEISGGFNNPLTLLALQGGAQVELVDDHDITFLGDNISKEQAQDVLVHLDMLLEAPPEEWKMASPVPDFPLYGTSELLSEKLCQFHKLCLAECTTFTQEQLGVFYLAMGQLEARLGADLESISSLHWDERSVYPQYGGPTLRFSTPGLSILMAKMAAGLNIKLKSSVTEIDYSGGVVKVHTPEGVYTASKVLVTVPVSLLPSIAFVPSLPPFKKEALNAIGHGHSEKIILKFGRRFWKENCPAFATLPDFTNRNFFNYFKDLTFKKEDGPFVLEVPVGGQAIHWLQERTDVQAVEACMAQLKLLFPDVPNPLGWSVTRWYQHPSSCMSGSFLRPGTSPVIIDDLAESLDHLVYFAGEATYRPAIGTAHGAYLSGLRAARQIYESYTPAEAKEELF